MACCRYFLLLSLVLSTFNTFSQTPVIDSLQRIVDLGKKDEAEARALTSLAFQFKANDITKTKTFLYAGIALAKALDHPVILSGLYSQLTILHLENGRKDSSLYYLSALKQLVTRGEGADHNKILYNYHSAAGLFYTKQRSYKEALPYQLEALRISERMSDKLNTAGQYLNTGNLYKDLGDIRKALQYHLKALRSFEILGHKGGESFCYQGIANDFIVLNQYRQALPYIQQSLKLKKGLNDKTGMANAFTGLGNIYQRMKKFNDALTAHKNALQLAKELQLVTSEVISNYNIGLAYLSLKDTTNAVTYFDQCRKLARQLGDSTTAAAVNSKMVILQNNVSRRQEAEKDLLSSLQTSVSSGDKPQEITNYEYLAAHYARNKQFEKALEYTNRFHHLIDSQQNKDLQLQIKKLEAQYSLEKKEQEIALLKKDALLREASLQKQRAFQYGALLFFVLLLLIGLLAINRYRVIQRTKRLIEIERIRNNIASDLHDDIGSALTSINVMSTIAMQEHNNVEGVQKYFTKIKNYSGNMMESMSDIVWAINPDNDDLEKIIIRMKEFAGEMLEPAGINYHFREEDGVNGIKLDLGQRKDLFLIYKEALNNAVKYSSATEVDILFKRHNTTLQMQIQDNGKGFDEQQKTSGNGLRNMKNRARQMQAELQVVAVPGKGTGICLHIPVT